MASAMRNRLMRRASSSSSSFSSSSSSLRCVVSKTNSASSSPACYRINSASFPPPNGSANASLLRHFASSSRSAAELGGVQSLLPIHSAVAAARMASCLSTASRSYRTLSLGILCCTSPGL